MRAEQRCGRNRHHRLERGRCEARSFRARRLVRSVRSSMWSSCHLLTCRSRARRGQEGRDLRDGHWVRRLVRGERQGSLPEDRGRIRPNRCELSSVATRVWTTRLTGYRLVSLRLVLSRTLWRTSTRPRRSRSSWTSTSWVRLFVLLMRPVQNCADERIGTWFCALEAAKRMPEGGSITLIGSMSGAVRSVQAWCVRAMLTCT